MNLSLVFSIVFSPGCDFCRSVLNIVVVKGQQALTFEVNDRVAAEDLELERMAAGSGDDRRYKRHRLVR